MLLAQKIELQPNEAQHLNNIWTKSEVL